MVKLFHLFPLQPLCHFKKSQAFWLLSFTSTENSHLSLPYLLSSTQGLLPANWPPSGFPEVWALSGRPVVGVGSGASKAGLCLSYLSSQESSFELYFHVLLTISQDHILLNTCVLSKIKDNLHCLNIP